MFISFTLLAFLYYVKSQYFCGKKIYDPYKFLELNQIKGLCSKINKNKFILSILENPSIGISISEDSTRLFLNLCKSLNICNSGILISFYFGENSLFIHNGPSNNISIGKINQIIKKGINFLSRGDYYSSLINIINSIKKYSSKNLKLNPSHIIPIQNNAMISIQTKKIYKNSFYNSQLFYIIVLILIILTTLIFILIACYLIKCDTDDEKERNYQFEQNRIEDNIMEHFNFIKKILYEIKKTSENKIQINFCLVCMENFSTQKDSFTTTLRRFQCGHFFHFQCIYECNSCILCIGFTDNMDSDEKTKTMDETEKNNRLTYSNLKSHHPFEFSITQQQILNLLANFPYIYEEHDLRNYYSENPKEVSMFEENVCCEVGNKMKLDKDNILDKMIDLDAKNVS